MDSNSTMEDSAAQPMLLIAGRRSSITIGSVAPTAKNSFSTRLQHKTSQHGCESPYLRALFVLCVISHIDGRHLQLQ